MTAKNFIRLQKGLKISKRAASVALNVTDFALKKQQKPPKRTVLITSLPRFRSVRIKMLRCLTKSVLNLKKATALNIYAPISKRKTVISVLVNFRKYTVFIVRITAVVFIQSLRLTNVKELKIITNSRYLCNKFTHARYRQKRYRCRRTYMCCVYAVYFCHQFRTQNVKFVCDKYGLSLVHYQL